MRAGAIVREGDDGRDRYRVVHAPPAPSLARHLSGYAAYAETTTSFTTRRELPHAGGVLIVNLGDPLEIVDAAGDAVLLRAGEGFAAGPHLAPAYSRSTGAQRGVHVFLPLPTLRHFLRTDMPALANRVVRLDDVIGAPARALGQRLGEAVDEEAMFAAVDLALGERLADWRPDPAVAAASRVLRVAPATPIAAIASRIGWSRQHFSERFSAELGLPPRRFARLARFEALMQALRGGSRGWADLAAAHGYADQAHLAREVREFAQLTPTALARRMGAAEVGVIEA